LCLQLLDSGAQGYEIDRGGVEKTIKTTERPCIPKKAEKSTKRQGKSVEGKGKVKRGNEG